MLPQLLINCHENDVKIANKMPPTTHYYHVWKIFYTLQRVHYKFHYEINSKVFRKKMILLKFINQF